ncbi:MAG: polysaccharide deacetylase family protein [Bacteroidota bacterium]
MKKAILLMGAGLLTIVALIGGFIAWSLNDVLFYLETDKKIVALTFDDGPNPEATPELLDVLDSLGIKATFFINGKHAVLYPDVLQETAQRGHEIGNHAWTHQALYHFSEDIPFEEIKETNKLIAEITGTTPSLFRPPFLVQGLGVKKSLAEFSLLSIGARVHGSDWEDQNPMAIADKVLASMKPGEIIVLHDGDGDAQKDEIQKSRMGTVEAVRIIGEDLLAQGYRFVTISEMIEMKEED